MEDAQQAAMELCRTSYPLLPERPGFPSVEQECSRLISSLKEQYLSNPSGSSLARTDLYLNKMKDDCLDGFPDDGQFCEKYYDDMKEHVKRLWFFVEGKLTLVVAGKGCVILADRVMGEAPNEGFCVGFLKGRFPGVIAGDPNKFDFPNLMKRSFPAGGTVSSMKDILLSAGFSCKANGEIDGRCTGSTGIIAFRNRRLWGIGGLGWTVDWHGDAAGTLQSLDVTAIGVSL